MRTPHLPKILLSGFAILFVSVSQSPALTAQDGLGEQIGAQIDRGLDELSNNLREGWASLQKTVDNFGIQGRVYSRLHWDKQLNDSQLDIDVEEKGVVLLRGVVPNSDAKMRATELAENTVGVKKLINQLTIAKGADLR